MQDQHEAFKQKRKFIVRLGKMLHKYGTPAYRLEAHLMTLADALGLRSSFIISPTSMTFVLWTEGHEDEYTHAARVDPGDLDMGSLSRTDDVVDLVLGGELSVEEAQLRLDEIEFMPNPYGRWATALSHGLTGGAFAMLMNTSANTAIWSALLGLVVYVFILWSERSKGITNMLEPLVSMMTAIGACAIAAYIDPGINIHLAVLSSIIVLVPGLALTIGLQELSARHLVSGTAKVMDAVMILFKLYFGAFVGIEIGHSLFGEVEYLAQPTLPKWSAWLAIFILGWALIIAFRTRRRHIVWSLLIGFVAYGSSHYGSLYFDLGIGAFLGAFMVGIYGNLFTRLANAPAVIVTMQGLIVLVPGSKTFISLNSYIVGEGFASAELAGQQSLVILMSIVAGLIFANSALPPKKSL
ncbi:threonine/serine exporter family protein [Psychrosphaera ytuae]|uniref:Threonine/serine exporter family protein n=1 Tax=Psychrosphaera ytuae TaxID=2820710 RepID=A0A975D9P7_9GAMM|nr:threonine/serine exporter family protein [Psychrosphaera ytuae]